MSSAEPRRMMPMMTFTPELSSLKRSSRIEEEKIENVAIKKNEATQAGGGPCVLRLSTARRTPHTAQRP